MKAYGIFSGGLDSILAARVLMDQGINPTLVYFSSPFFHEPHRARQGADALGLEMVVCDIYDDLLALIKSPVYGHGRNLNPCIDCHALMLRRAAGILKSSGEDGFVFSGEVLGQRPMSQNSRALKKVADEAGLSGKILRPLSAKLLPVTEAEEKGLVNRDGLLALSGRGRRAQMDMAAAYGLPTPTPAGGCLLTDMHYSRRLSWLLAQPQNSDPCWPPQRLAMTLKYGRVFSAEPGQWLCVGRCQQDNEHLRALASPGDIIFHLEGFPGPTVLLPNSYIDVAESTFNLACSLAASYGDNNGAQEVQVSVQRVGEGSELKTVKVEPASPLGEFMIQLNGKNN